LLPIIQAHDTLGSLFAAGEGRQQQSGKDPNDGDRYQQLDKCESSPPPGT
jgi:hypothetical protein